MCSYFWLHLRKRLFKVALHERVSRKARPRRGRRQRSYTVLVRAFSLLFAFIALVLLAQFLLFVTRGPVDTSFDKVIAGALFVGFLFCLVPALYLLKPFGSREDLRRRREARRERERHREPTPPEDKGS